MTERDVRTLLFVQALRALGYGFASVLLGSALANAGLSATDVGLVFSTMLAGMAITSITLGTVGHRLPRRRLYTALLLVMGCGGAVFALTTRLPLLVAAALTGTLSTDPNESGPITSIEQAMLGGATPSLRARVFGRYNAVAYVAGSVGALAAGGPSALRGLLPALPADQRWLLVVPVIAAASALVSLRLSAAADAGSSGGRASLVRSRRTVTKLAVLFGIDAGAGGFVVQAFLVFWFRRRFGTSPQTLGLLFFGVGLLQAGSSIVAGRLGARIGLLRTMVLTHLPSNVLLAVVPFAPSFPLAAVALLLRSSLSQMDVPARQAYVVAMVDPEERTSAALYTNAVRYVARPAGPVGAGALMQHQLLAAPFVVAGGVKIVYDVLLYAIFRKVRLDDPGAP